VALKPTCIKNVKFKIFKVQVVSTSDILLQRKPKLGRTKPSTGPHAARGLDTAGLAWEIRLTNSSRRERSNETYVSVNEQSKAPI